jgi:hypothetical protein
LVMNQPLEGFQQFPKNHFSREGEKKKNQGKYRVPKEILS